jgi:hypothetical protein
VNEIKDLALLTNTTITATCALGWAQLTLEKVTSGLRATMIAHASGKQLGPIQRELKGKTGAVAKALFVGPLLKEGFDYLKVKARDVPDGLPVKIEVGEAGCTYAKEFMMPMDVGAMARFYELIKMVKTVNDMAKR